MVLDPVSALGVAAAAAQFLDYSTSLISKGVKIYKHVSNKGAGFTTQHANLEMITKDLLRHSNDLEKSAKGAPVGDSRKSNDEELQQLCLACSQVASELLAALADSKLKFMGKFRELKSFRHALGAIWPEEEIDSLQQRLDGFRQQLIINILVSLRQKEDEAFQQQSTLMRTITKLDHRTQTIGQEFLEYVDESKRWRTDLIDAIYQGNADLDKDNIEPDLNLVTPGNSVGSRSVVSKFLDNIQFKHMTDRHERIAEAYEETFQWLYRPSNEGANSWDDFVQWLEDGSQPNIYWITGKAGSGKSTLMKYIYDNPITQEHLKTWASELPVVTVPFFFWNSGTTMQNSRFGLVLSLLHGCLSQCTSLIPRVSPKRWEAYRLFGDDYHPWTWVEARQALRTIIDEDGKTARFCFMIDGLDEFDGDSTDILDLIQNLLSTSKIKICVSSRPWPVFEDAFKQKPSLVLPHLKSHDIRHFASTKLYASPGYAELEKREPDFARTLIDEIATKSSGVFLWVHFVVRSLLQGLTDGDRISDLQRRLNDLPEELEALFNNILDTVSPQNLQHASELFQIVRAARTPLSLLSLSFADEEDPQLAIDFQIRTLSSDEKLARCTTMKRRLNSRCKGLLEVAPTNLDATELAGFSSLPLALFSCAPEEPLSPDSSEKSLQDRTDIEMLSQSAVQYLHRTVKDYLERPDVWDRILSTTVDSFDPNVSLCRSFIVQIKTMTRESLTLENFWNLVLPCMYYAAQAQPSSTKFVTELLDELDRAAGQVAAKPTAHGQSLISLHVGSGKLGKVVPDWSPRKIMPHWSSTGIRWLSDYSFLCLAVEGGLYSYVKLKLEEGCALEQGWACPSLLDCAISKYKVLTSDPEWPFPDSGRVEMIQLLLGRGADPNRIDCITSTPWRNLLDCIRKEREEIKLRKPKSPPFNRWRMKDSNLQYDNKNKFPLTAYKSKMEYWMQVIEMFIQHGADSWINLGTATAGALREHDDQKAQDLETMLKRRRRSWPQIKRLAGRR